MREMTEPLAQRAGCVVINTGNFLHSVTVDLERLGSSAGYCVHISDYCVHLYTVQIIVSQIIVYT